MALNNSRFRSRQKQKPLYNHPTQRNSNREAGCGAVVQKLKALQRPPITDLLHGHLGTGMATHMIAVFQRQNRCEQKPSGEWGGGVSVFRSATLLS